MSFSLVFEAPHNAAFRISILSRAVTTSLPPSASQTRTVASKTVTHLNSSGPTYFNPSNSALAQTTVSVSQIGS